MAAAWRPATRLVWAETPSNPMLAIVDIAAVAADRPRPIGPAGGRQHLRHPLPAAAARPRRRHRGALDHQVPRRPQRRGRRVRRDRRPGPGRAGGLLPERRRRRPRPLDCYLVLRGLKTLAVRMDRHCANAAAVVEMLVRPPGRGPGVLPGLPSHPGHGGRPPDARLRRHGVVRPGGGRGGGAGGGPIDPAVHPGRVARGGGVADRTPPPDDPRLGRRLAPGGATRVCCGCRSGWRRSPTWSPTWSAPWTGRAAGGSASRVATDRRLELAAMARTAGRALPTPVATARGGGWSRPCGPGGPACRRCSRWRCR